MYVERFGALKEHTALMYIVYIPELTLLVAWLLGMLYLIHTTRLLWYSFTSLNTMYGNSAGPADLAFCRCSTFREMCRNVVFEETGQRRMKVNFMVQV